MKNLGKIALCALGLALFAPSVRAEDSTPLSKDDMSAVRGEGYISYGALNHDSTPCSKRGSSAANCRPGTPANPYTRGCSAINRCRQ